MSRKGSARSTKSARSVTWSTTESAQVLVKDKEECEEDDDMVDQAARAAKAKVMRFAEIFSGEMKSESQLLCFGDAIKEICFTTGMWSSREMMKDDSDKQLYVKTTLRELIIYFIFLVTVLISEMLMLITLEKE